MQVGSGRGYLAVVVDFVAADGGPDATRVVFLGAVIGDDAKVGGFLAFGKLGPMQESNGFGGDDVVADATIGEPADLVA